MKLRELIEHLKQPDLGGRDADLVGETILHREIEFYVGMQEEANLLSVYLSDDGKLCIDIG